MSYKDDILVLRNELERLGYRQLPFVAILDEDDFSTAYQDMGYSLVPYEIEGVTVSNNGDIGSRLYRLQVSYEAQGKSEFDEAWDKYEALYRSIHSLTKTILSNELIKLTEKQFIYKGELEFSYGKRSCI